MNTLIERLRNLRLQTIALIYLSTMAPLTLGIVSIQLAWTATGYASVGAGSVIYVIAGALYIFNRRAFTLAEQKRQECRE